MIAGYEALIEARRGKDWSKPILRRCRDGWRYAFDMRFLTDAGLAGCIAYVGPFPTAGDAFEEAAAVTAAFR